MPRDGSVFRPMRADWMHASMVVAALFALYALTAPRTVALEDDGLFILSSYFLGIEHPPGYPLFTLVGKLFTYLPFGSVAYRVHLASAFFGALSCGVAWLCARLLIGARLPAHVAAFGLGLSPVFWSQAIIAEVYTLNTFFLLGLAYLGLRACPVPGFAGGPQAGRLPWIAFLFGLSLSNHWPLMLLCAPGFAILLWPVRAELMRRSPLLLGLVALGLVPYVWLVFLSWTGPPISHYGPLESVREFWYFVSREGYSDIDQKLSASWLDRLEFFQFFGAQLLVQFAVLGTALAAIGFAVQRRLWGRRVSAFLLSIFLMSSIGLLVLLRFDYDAIQKHIFHVYPLPAYAVAALWMGLGFDWLVRRFALPRLHASMAGVALVALLFGVGFRTNFLAEYDWAARYAQALLKTFPKDAVVLVTGEADLAPIAYFHMVENWRPDITLYQPSGMVLGNRLFHPLRTDEATGRRMVRELVERETRPVVSTSAFLTGLARRDRWLYFQVDKESPDPERVTIDIPEEAVRFFEGALMNVEENNGWAAFFQGELRRRYALLVGQSLRPGEVPDARTRRHMEALSRDFYGALGLAQGLMANERGYTVGDVVRFLERARDLMPADAAKEHQSAFFYLRGALRAGFEDRRGAIADFEMALSVWPVPDNPATGPLNDLKRTTTPAP